MILIGTKLHFKSPTAERRHVFSASGLAGIEPTPPAPKGAGYVRHDHSATVSMTLIKYRIIVS